MELNWTSLVRSDVGVVTSGVTGAVLVFLREVEVEGCDSLRSCEASLDLGEDECGWLNRESNKCFDQFVPGVSWMLSLRYFLMMRAALSVLIS